VAASSQKGERLLERKALGALKAAAVDDAVVVDTAADTDECKITPTMWDTPTDLSCYNTLSVLDPSTPEKLKHVFHEHPRDLSVRHSHTPFHPLALVIQPHPSCSARQV